MADGVYKLFVENSPKCLKIIFPNIIEKIVELIVEEQEYSLHIANQCVINLS